MSLSTRSRTALRTVSLAAGLAFAAPAFAAVVPGDPYAGDPTGIVEEPCPVHPPAEGAEAAVIAKLHQVTRDFGQLCRYRQENQAVLAAGRPVKAVFMGDSITERWLKGDPTFFDPQVLDRGISGQTTQQMLTRFRQDVIALRPKAVHLMAATNDVAGNTGATTLETVEGAIESMVELAQAHGIVVMLASIPPADRFEWSPDKTPAATIKALNRWLKAYAARKGLAYVDYYAVLATPEGAMKPEFAKDGVHPNAEGYAAMRPIAKAALQRALR